MASVKDIRKRIKSVEATKKITRTMEMIATSRMKRALDRVLASQPYLNRLEEVLGRLAASGAKVEHPLLRQPESIKKSTVFLITANRGLCGAYNSNLIKKARVHLADLKSQGREVELQICGKKGIRFFKFIGEAVAKSYTDLTDRPTFADADRFAQSLMDDFTSGRTDSVDLVFAHYISAGKQPPIVYPLLPLKPTVEAAGEGGKAKASADFIFEPDPATILGELLPLSVKNGVYRALIESVVSEQIARRVAMKNATDNAEEMIRSLTLKMNNLRQARITAEISELVGGAEALK